jgi:hypothetical protein
MGRELLMRQNGEVEESVFLIYSSIREPDIRNLGSCMILELHLKGVAASKIMHVSELSFTAPY